MQTHIKGGRVARLGLLAAAAAVALFAQLPAALADQQRSDEAVDTALSHEQVMAPGNYAQAPAPVPYRRHPAR
jgi:hypothetical protein